MTRNCVLQKIIQLILESNALNCFSSQVLKYPTEVKFWSSMLVMVAVYKVLASKCPQ